MKTETIALNLRGVTQTYELDPLPAHRRIMEPLFFSQPTFLLIPLPGVNSVLLAPVKTCMQQASLQLSTYLLCHRAGHWYRAVLHHNRRGSIWNVPLFLFLLNVHHDPFFFGSSNPGSTEFHSHALPFSRYHLINTAQAGKRMDEWLALPIG